MPAAKLLNSLSKGLYNIAIFCIRETVDPVHRRRALYARGSNRNLLPPLAANILKEK